MAKILMPSEEEAVKLIRAAGHTISEDSMRWPEWGDTPCNGPQCETCGDVWCLWERWLEVEPCQPL